MYVYEGNIPVVFVLLSLRFMLCSDKVRAPVPEISDGRTAAV